MTMMYGVAVSVQLNGRAKYSHLSLIDTVYYSTIMVHTILRLPSIFFVGQKLVRKRISIQVYSQSKATT